MKIAVSVGDENLHFFGNAGHTPLFAIFDMNGSGMFRSFNLLEVRKNPRSDIDHEHPEDEHQCDHDEGDEEHIAQHDKMGQALQDCDYLVTKRACKNTAGAMKKHDIKVLKYDGMTTDASTVLKEVASKFL
jgi:predicted Fe-Mo cluster-binding NifX family protein